MPVTGTVVRAICLMYDELLEIHKYKVKMGKKYMTEKQSNLQRLLSVLEYSQ